jgi:glycosyltransferase involved in cell wall biosynthesis
MSSHTLAVILPNYNHGKYLPTAMQALLDKTRPPDEIVVIDDGSTDNSWEIIQDFASRSSSIRPFRNEKNMGPLYTVNRALGLTQADYIYSGASDDCVLPGFFEKCMDLLAKHPEAGLCCTIGDWHEVSSGLHWQPGAGMADVPSYFSPRKMIELERQGRLFIPTNTAVMKRSALLEAGGFLHELKCICDWFADYVIGFRYGICYVPEALARFNILPTSYYKKHRRVDAEFNVLLENLMRFLTQPKYQDAAELIREGGSLYIHSTPILKILLQHPEYRRFITPNFLRKNLWHASKLGLKRVTPAFVGNVYLRFAGGYHARTPAPEAAT